MPRNYFAGDPHWITAHYDGKCSECGTEIKKGDRAFYFPNGKKILCEAVCGRAAHERFVEEAELEYAVTGPLTWEGEPYGY